MLVVSECLSVLNWPPFFFRFSMSSTSKWRWTTFVVLRSQRVQDGPSCVTGTAQGSFLLSGASKMASLSAPHQVCLIVIQTLSLDNHDHLWYQKARNDSDHSACLRLSPLDFIWFLYLLLLPPICLLCPPSLFISTHAGYQGPDFDWADYLKQCEAEAAPQHCFSTVSQAEFYPCVCACVLASMCCNSYFSESKMYKFPVKELQQPLIFYV